MGEMTAALIVRLIRWLKAQGMTDEQIVQCFEYINSRDKKEKK